MDRHNSLLLLTYLGGLAFGIAGAVLITLASYESRSPIHFNCMDAGCSLLNHALPVFSVTLFPGALIALLTVLLSRGLYRLFFTQNN